MPDPAEYERNLGRDRSIRALRALIFWADGLQHREIGELLMDVETQTRPVSRVRVCQMVDLGKRLMLSRLRDPEAASRMAERWATNRKRRLAERRAAKENGDAR